MGCIGMHRAASIRIEGTTMADIYVLAAVVWICTSRILSFRGTIVEDSCQLHKCETYSSLLLKNGEIKITDSECGVSHTRFHRQITPAMAFQAFVTIRACMYIYDKAICNMVTYFVLIYVEGCSDKRVYKRIGIGSVVEDLAPAAADLLVLVDWLAVVQVWREHKQAVHHHHAHAR
jgi:hypothetical protein